MLFKNLSLDRESCLFEIIQWTPATFLQPASPLHVHGVELNII